MRPQRIHATKLKAEAKERHNNQDWMSFLWSHGSRLDFVQSRLLRPVFGMPWCCSSKFLLLGLSGPYLTKLEYEYWISYFEYLQLRMSFLNWWTLTFFYVESSFWNVGPWNSMFEFQEVNSKRLHSDDLVFNSSMIWIQWCLHFQKTKFNDF